VDAFVIVRERWGVRALRDGQLIVVMRTSMEKSRIVRLPGCGSVRQLFLRSRRADGRLSDGFPTRRRRVSGRGRETREILRARARRACFLWHDLPDACALTGAGGRLGLTPVRAHGTPAPAPSSRRAGITDPSDAGFRRFPSPKGQLDSPDGTFHRGGGDAGDPVVLGRRRAGPVHELPDAVGADGGAAGDAASHPVRPGDAPRAHLLRAFRRARTRC